MSGLEDKVVLITGASSGIGAATAIEFAQKGCRLALVARNTEKLEKVKLECQEAGAAEVIILPHDLSTLEHCDLALNETTDHYNGNSCKCYLCTSVPCVLFLLTSTFQLSMCW